MGTDPKITHLTALAIDAEVADATVEQLAIETAETLREDAFSLTSEDLLAMGAAMADFEAYRAFSAGDNDALAGRGEFVEFLIEQIAENA